MEKIIQLEEREYNQLFDKASLNETQIKELAEQYYRDRGVFRIDIKAEVAGNYTGYLNYKTFSFTAENYIVEIVLLQSFPKEVVEKSSQ